MLSTRPKSSPVWDYFEHIENSDPSAARCKVGKCNAAIPMLKSSSSGLWSHLKSHHKLEYSIAAAAKTLAADTSKMAAQKKLDLYILADDFGKESKYFLIVKFAYDVVYFIIFLIFLIS